MSDSLETDTAGAPPESKESNTLAGYSKLLSVTSDPSNPEAPSDTGPVGIEWAQELLHRYTSELSKFDNQEKLMLQRLEAIQRLQLLWATAGRIGEMNRSNRRIKTRTTKVLLEDEGLSKKRRKLGGAMAALQNVVGMLDEAESTGESGGGG